MATTIQKIETPKRARALDTSGNNNHGQIYSGRALEFDGVADYLSVADTAKFNIGHADHTLTGWFNTSDLGSGAWNYAISDYKVYDDGLKCLNNFSSTSDLEALSGVRTNSIFQQVNDTPSYWWFNGTRGWSKWWSYHWGWSVTVS